MLQMHLLTSLGNKYYQDASRWGCCATTRSDCGANLAVGCVDGSMIYQTTASGSGSLTNSLITLAWYVPSTQIPNANSRLTATVHQFGQPPRIDPFRSATLHTCLKTSATPPTLKSTLSAVYHPWTGLTIVPLLWLQQRQRLP